MGTWLAAGLFLVSAVLGVLTYLIRRHRTDDYRGRYRMWYWMVPFFVMVSLDQVADLQLSIRTVLLDLAGIPDYADATLIWMASAAVVAGAVGIRLAIEMRACRAAVAGLVLAAGCYAAVGAATVNWVLADGGVFRVMAMTGLAMLGHVSVLMAMSLNARHVHREARGEIGPRVRRKRRKREQADGTTQAARRNQRGSDADSLATRRVRRPAGATLRKDASHAPESARADESRSTAADVSAARRKRKLTAAVAGKPGASDDVTDDAACSDEEANAPANCRRRNGAACGTASPGAVVYRPDDLGNDVLGSQAHLTGSASTLYSEPFVPESDARHDHGPYAVCSQPDRLPAHWRSPHGTVQLAVCPPAWGAVHFAD